MQDTGGFFIAILEKKAEFRAKPESDAKKTSDTKPPITSIVDEIESRPAPVDGGSVAPKIGAADGLTGPSETATEVTLVARQNQENPTPDATVSGTKRSAEEDEEEVVNPKNVSRLLEHYLPTVLQFDAVSRAKKLKTKEDIDEPAEAGFQDRQVHYPPSPGAELDLNTRPGDLRDDKPTPSFRPNPNRNRNNQQFEEPFKYISGDHIEVQTIESFYKLSPRFPRDRFMVRNAQGEPAKTIYYTSALIRDILTENEGKGIKFVHGGVRMFMKQDVQGEGVCKWRIQSEGMPILEGYVGSERVVRLYKKETLRKLLIEMFPKLSDGAWENLGEIGERVNNIGMGCCVLRIEPSTEADGFSERMVIPLWRSLHSLNLMLAKEDRTAMLLRIFNDTTPLVNNHNPSKKGKDEPAPPPKVEDDAMEVDDKEGAMGSIEGSAPVKEDAAEAVIKPGPYDTIVAAAKNGTELDVKAERIVKGEDTEGGGVEGQVGGLP
jgi:multisite-specific tRNA:(cytosine-C5)-methyltransferase